MYGVDVVELSEAWFQEAIDAGEEQVELVALEVRGDRRNRLVRLYVDSPGGITHELCARVSALVGEQLDRTGYADGPYTLEVSSPGLERPLRKRAHFEAQIGKKVYVKTTEPTEGRKVWRGELVEVRDQRIVVRDGQQEVELDIDGIAQAHLVYEFE